MKKIELTGLDQTLYYEKLPSGLELYMVPFQNKNNFAVHYVTKYGSRITKFVPAGEKEMIQVPDGIAHFLEHKMFETESGEDPFSFYAKSGTDCNASTSWKCTRYLFEGTNSFDRNLDYLLTYVNQPYFTDQNVEKEKGIIAEEIKMYDDEPMWCLDHEIKQALFQKDPMRIDIAGTVESIQKITKEDLYACYHTFYQPSNMFLVAVGAIDPEQVVSIVQQNEALNSKKNHGKITVAPWKEPKEVTTSYKEVEMDVSVTKMALSIKIPWDKKMDHYEYSTYCGMILTALFGMSSAFREKYWKEKYFSSFGQEREYTEDYIVFQFLAETEKPKELAQVILDTLEHGKITKEDIERIKKVWLSSEVMMIDNIDVTLDNIVYDIIEYGHIIPNKLDIIRHLDYDRLTEIRKKLDISNHALVVMKKREEEAK